VCSVEGEILLSQGTNVVHNITFGDDTSISTTDNVVIHAYVSAGFYQIHVVSYNGAAQVMVCLLLSSYFGVHSCDFRKW